ncbi:MAG: flavodoxin family protein [Desulfobacterales bacterium]
MDEIIAIYGSPRRNGNTATLLKESVAGAREAGARVHEVFLRDLKMSPCLEIYGCKKEGKCVIQDDFGDLRDRMLAAKGLMLASPVFFYTVSAHTKILMDRCQSLWVKKHWVENALPKPATERKGMFIGVGATRGKKLFDGILLTIRYFFEVLDMSLDQTLLYRGLDAEKDVLAHPEYLAEARSAGRRFAESLRVLGKPPDDAFAK